MKNPHEDVKPPIPGNQSEESRHSLSELFKAELAEILKGESISQVSLPAHAALDQLVHLIEKIIIAYRKASGDVGEITEKFENAAFKRFNLQDINHTLTVLGERHSLVQRLINGATEVGVFIVPTDSGPGVQNDGGGKHFKFSALVPRTEQVLQFILAQGVQEGDLNIQKGTLPQGTFRTVSYYTIEVKSKKRFIFVSNQIGNATFVFDTNKLSHDILAKLHSHTKNEFNSFMQDYPGSGVRIVYRPNWGIRILNALEGDIPPYEENQKSERTGESVLDRHLKDRNPISPWFGFWRVIEDEEESHYGTLEQISKKIGLSESALRSFLRVGIIDKTGIPTLAFGKKGGKTIYCYESFVKHPKVEDHLKVMDLPQVDADGFVEIEGVLWGSLNSIGRKHKLAESTLCNQFAGSKDKNVLETFATKRFRDTYNKVIVAYSEEEVMKHQLIVEYLPTRNLPQVGADGFIEINGALWGSLESIARKNGLVEGTLYEFFGTKQNKAASEALSTKRVLNSIGRVFNAHSEKEVMQHPLVRGYRERRVARLKKK